MVVVLGWWWRLAAGHSGGGGEAHGDVVFRRATAGVWIDRGENAGQEGRRHPEGGGVLRVEAEVLGVGLHVADHAGGVVEAADDVAGVVVRDGGDGDRGLGHGGGCWVLGWGEGLGDLDEGFVGLDDEPGEPAAIGEGEVGLLDQTGGDPGGLPGFVDRVLLGLEGREDGQHGDLVGVAEAPACGVGEGAGAGDHGDRFGEGGGGGVGHGRGCWVGLVGRVRIRSH